MQRNIRCWDAHQRCPLTGSVLQAVSGLELRHHSAETLACASVTYRGWRILAESNRSGLWCALTCVREPKTIWRGRSALGCAGWCGCSAWRTRTIQQAGFPLKTQVENHSKIVNMADVRGRTITAGVLCHSGQDAGKNRRRRGVDN